MSAFVKPTAELGAGRPEQPQCKSTWTGGQSTELRLKGLVGTFEERHVQSEPGRNGIGRLLGMLSERRVCREPRRAYASSKIDERVRRQSWGQLERWSSFTGDVWESRLGEPVWHV